LVIQSLFADGYMKYRLASALPGFVQRLFEGSDLDYLAEKPAAVFAVHPGGPRIIELAEKLLALDPGQVAWSRHVLREHGNMSSATLPHIWQQILMDQHVAAGTLIVSFGAGPGLTLSGALFRKR
jgi:predicted naringenin-chalcone synthase